MNFVHTDELHLPIETLNYLSVMHLKRCHVMPSCPYHVHTHRIITRVTVCLTTRSMLSKRSDLHHYITTPTLESKTI